MPAIALQVVCSLLIVAAVVFYLLRNKRAQVNATPGRNALAVFQIVLCGWFFSLCISDFLDIQVSFSLERLVVNIFYIIAFLSLAVYVLFNEFKEGSAYLRGVVGAFLALIIVQCFVFPYGTEQRVLQVFEDIEGVVVFGLLVAFLLKMEDARFGQICLVVIVALELLVAVENTVVPFDSITNDFQAVDIPLNHASLFMRPALFASLALAYRAWLERRGLARR